MFHACCKKACTCSYFALPCFLDTDLTNECVSSFHLCETQLKGTIPSLAFSNLGKLGNFHGLEQVWFAQVCSYNHVC